MSWVLCASVMSKHLEGVLKSIKIKHAFRSHFIASIFPNADGSLCIAPGHCCAVNYNYARTHGVRKQVILDHNIYWFVCHWRFLLRSFTRCWNCRRIYFGRATVAVPPSSAWKEISKYKEQINKSRQDSALNNELNWISPISQRHHEILLNFPFEWISVLFHCCCRAQQQRVVVVVFAVACVTIAILHVLNLDTTLNNAYNN